MASRLLHHCVPVDVGQQTEAKPDGYHDQDDHEDDGYHNDDDDDEEDEDDEDDDDEDDDHEDDEPFGVDDDDDFTKSAIHEYQRYSISQLI